MLLIEEQISAMKKVAQWRRTFGAARLALRVCRSVPLTGLPGRLRRARFSPLFLRPRAAPPG